MGPKEHTFSKILAKPFVIINASSLGDDSKIPKHFIDSPFCQSSLHHICPIKVIHTVSPDRSGLDLDECPLGRIEVEIASDSLLWMKENSDVLRTLDCPTHLVSCRLERISDPSACFCTHDENQNIDTARLVN
jgi:hypothetical protein